VQQLVINSNKGLLITLDGLDGCGKSTQAERLCMYCSANNIPFIHLAQPGSTLLSNEIRAFIKTNKMLNESRLLLLLTAWVDTFLQTVGPALFEGKVVISERGWSSFVAYQGFGAGQIEWFNNSMFNLAYRAISKYNNIDLNECYLYLNKSHYERASLKDIESDEIERTYSKSHQLIADGFSQFSDEYNILSRLRRTKCYYKEIDCNELSFAAVTDNILHALNSIDSRFEPLRFYQGT